MNLNPFDRSTIYQVDLDDFNLPYKLQSRTDIEVMKRRYQSLNKVSYKYIVRTGIVYQPPR